MQKSQRGLMRSAKQHRRRQRLFAAGNNNNPISCRGSPSLPLLKLPALKLADCRWFCHHCLPPTTPASRLAPGVTGPPSSRTGADWHQSASASCPYWPLKGISMEWNLVTASFETRSEFRTRQSRSNKTEIVHVKRDQPSLFCGYKMILMIKIHHLASWF